MSLVFSEVIPFDSKPVLISGEDSKDLHNIIYIVDEANPDSPIFEIRFEYFCSPFKEILKSGSLIAAGNENHFYLFDLIGQKNLLTLEIEGYFGGIYFQNDIFYVTGACGIYAVEKSGNVLWSNNTLAVDGVLISHITENEIHGTAEQDPPGGWQAFTINRRTGF